MGTPSLTHIYENEDSAKPFVTIYRQFDGYPEGLGSDIKEILGNRTLVNGYSDAKSQTNGIQCAAAMLVAGLKEGCGNVYLYPAGSSDCGEEYVYHLYPSGSTFRLKIEGYDKPIYDGPLPDFDPQPKAVAL